MLDAIRALSEPDGCGGGGPEAAAPPSPPGTGDDGGERPAAGVFAVTSPGAGPSRQHSDGHGSAADGSPSSPEHGPGPETNWKNKLNEWLQQNARQPLGRGAYATTPCGPAHEPFFRCELRAVPGLDGGPFRAGGPGFRRARQAEQEAARLACAHIPPAGRVAATSAAAAAGYAPSAPGPGGDVH